jgi:hypothetical protein
VLNPTEYNYLLDKLQDRLAGVEARVYLDASLPKACMRKIAYLQMPAAYAQAVLDVCQTDGRNSDPMWILLLINLLPDEPRTAEIKLRISTAPVEPDPELARILMTGTPFLNRSGLRRTVASLLGGKRSPRPIFVVSGETKSGKSYSAEYIDHLSLAGRPFTPFKVRFPTGSGLTYGPEGLARDILMNMGITPDGLPPGFFENTTNNERWPYDLAGSVLAKGHQLGKCFWIVLDAFTGTELRKETGKFIDGLAQGIVDSAVFGETFRLILLDFERTLLSVQPSRVDLERIEPFGETDVFDCVAEIFRRLRKQPGIKIEKAVDQIMKDLPAGEGRLPETNQRLLDLMKLVQ